MTTDERIFRSTRVTQAPSFGIVQGAGMRAEANLFRQAGGIFDEVAEFANQKLDQKAARDAREQAEHDVRAAGLNPAQLDDPITKADEIYREAAINTYTIQVEDDLNTTVSTFALEHDKDPQAFLAKSKGYVEGKINSLPIELRTPFEKQASALVSTEALRIKKALREQAIQETKALNAAKLDEYTAAAVNAGPEERQTHVAKALALIEADATTANPELKAARFRKFENDLLLGAKRRDVALGDVTPADAIRELEAAGIAVTPDVMRSIYNSYGIEEEFENRKAAQASAARAAQAQAVEDTVYQAMMEQNLTEQEFVKVREEAAKVLVSIGEAERAMKFRQSASDQYYNIVIDSPEVVSDLEQLVDSVSPEAEASIDIAVRQNVLSAIKARELKNELQVNRGSIKSSPEWKEFGATYLLSQYPYAFYTEAQILTLDPNLRPEAERQIAIVNNIATRVNERVNNPDEAKRVSLPTALSEVQSQQEQRPSAIVESVPVSNPRMLEVQRTLIEEKPVYRHYNSMAQGIQKMVDYTIDDLATAPPEVRRHLELFRGPFTHKNHKQRLNVMIAENEKYFRQNPDGRHPPYDLDLVEGIANTYGTSIKNLREALPGE